MSDDHQVKKRKLSPECDECQARKQKLASVSEEKPEVLTPGTPTSETSTSETSTSKASTPETVASDASTSATSASEPDEHQAKKRKLTSGSDSAPETPLRIRRHSKKARVPTRGSPQAAGYDLYRLDIIVLDCTVGLCAIQCRAENHPSSGESRHRYSDFDCGS